MWNSTRQHWKSFWKALKYTDKPVWCLLAKYFKDIYRGHFDEKESLLAFLAAKEAGCCQWKEVRGVIIAGQSWVTTQYTPRIQLKSEQTARGRVRARACVSAFVCAAARWSGESLCSATLMQLTAKSRRVTVQRDEKGDEWMGLCHRQTLTPPRRAEWLRE